MPQYICKHEDIYFVWSTVTDSPIFVTKSFEELNEFEECTADRMKRVAQKGTSSVLDQNLRELVEYNRAGEKESDLPFDDLIAMLRKRLDEKDGK